MESARILSVFAVIAAAGMVPAGCESPAGVGNGKDEAVSAEAPAPVLNSAGAQASAADYASGIKTIKVKFNVKNGGAGGLWKSEGIVSGQDDIICFVYNHGVCANDYTITIPVLKDDEYLNIRWRGLAGVRETFVRAKMKPDRGVIVLDYNGHGKGIFTGCPARQYRAGGHF